MNIECFKTFKGLFHSNSVISVTYETFFMYLKVLKKKLKQNLLFANIYHFLNISLNPTII